jgi:hypothetical protein
VGDGAAGGQAGEGRADVGVGEECAGAVAVGEYASAAAAQPVPVLGGGDLEPLDAAREGDAVVGLDDELDRVGAHAELDDAEVGARERRAERASDGAARAVAAERDAAGEAGDDVNRVVRRVLGARVVGFARDRTLRAASGVGASAAPARNRPGRIMCDLYDLHVHVEFAEISSLGKFTRRILVSSITDSLR